MQIQHIRKISISSSFEANGFPAFSSSKDIGNLQTADSSVNRIPRRAGKKHRFRFAFKNRVRQSSALKRIRSIALAKTILGVCAGFIPLIFGADQALQCWGRGFSALSNHLSHIAPFSIKVEYFDRTLRQRRVRNVRQFRRRIERTERGRWSATVKRKFVQVDGKMQANAVQNPNAGVVRQSFSLCIMTAPYKTDCRFYEGLTLYCFFTEVHHRRHQALPRRFWLAP